MKGRKRGRVLAAVLALLLSASPRTVYGAKEIQTETPCSVEFCLTNLRTGTGDALTEDAAEYEGLSGGKTEAPVAVNLYRVADISAYGMYTVTGSGEGADALQDALKDVGADTDQETWLQIAELAETYAGVDPENGVFPDTGERKTIGGGGTVTFTDLDTGLYLAAAEPVQSAEYRYTFAPYLISLPDNRYYQTQEDAWIYDLTGDCAVGLKAAWETRYVDLVIQKTLDSYDRTLGEVSCVFRIEAEKGPAFHYSDVVSLQFDGRELTRSLTVSGKIPAESKVTVTEVYAGAGYQLQGTSGVRELTVKAAGPNEAVFVNEHQDDSLKGGSSVVNHFVNLGIDDITGKAVWDNEQMKDSTVESVKGGGNSEAESE